MVCHSFYLQTWVEAFNAAGVDSSFELRNLEKGVLSPNNQGAPSHSAPCQHYCSNRLALSRTLHLSPTPLSQLNPNQLSNLPQSPMQLLPKALRWRPRHPQWKKVPSKPKRFLLLRLQLTRHNPPRKQGSRRLPMTRESNSQSALLLFYFYFCVLI